MTKTDLVKLLTRLDCDDACISGTQIIPIHRDRLRTILSALTAPTNDEVREVVERLRKGCDCQHCKLDACSCAVMDEAAALLERLSPDAVRDDGWQDISTAPDCEDGVIICDANKPNPAVGVARLTGDGLWRGFDHGMGCECFYPTPTHWRPLPPPPAIRKDAPDA